MTNLERWNFYLKDYESPQLFIDWTYYTMISAVLARRVALNGRPDLRASNLIFPNVFVVFVAKAGIGKSIAATEAKRIIQSFDGYDKSGKPTSLIKLGPSSVTIEALLRYLNLNFESIQVPKELAGKDGKIYTHSSIALLRGEELGTLLREDTYDLVTFLCEGWDCGDFHRETKTAGVDYIRNMCITMLGACTPSWVQQNISSRIISEGFSARTVFVFADAKRFLRPRILFNNEQHVAREQIRTHIGALSKLYGEVVLTEDARCWQEDWYLNRNKVLNTDKRLEDYYARKRMHLEKLAMLMHFADKTSLVLEVDDYERALALLNLTEQTMHQALLGSGSNPVYSLASNIHRYITQHHKATFKRLLLEFFDEAPKGQEDVKAALEFLVDTHQIRASAATGEMTYSIKDEQSDEQEPLSEDPS